MRRPSTVGAEELIEQSRRLHEQARLQLAASAELIARSRALRARLLETSARRARPGEEAAAAGRPDQVHRLHPSGEAGRVAAWLPADEAPPPHPSVRPARRAGGAGEAAGRGGPGGTRR